MIRERIEAQVLGLTGLALGGIDFEQPAGDPGLFGPDSAAWRVHGDFTSMLVGGIAALMLQMLHPLALAGVWDHSNFRQDMLGRLRRTGQFISGTTYGSAADAERLIARVRGIHEQVRGAAPDGTPYAADDPDLLTWVHVAEVSSFLAAHLRYLDPGLPGAEQDRYYDEISLIAYRLGARAVPRSRAEVAAYIARMRSQLACSDRTREISRILLDHPPAVSVTARPVSRIMMQAGIGLLPDWASAMLGLEQGPWRRRAVERSVHAIAPVLRWAVRNGSAHRARRRMGLPARAQARI
ncbi:hypothetical protein PIGHUM_01176 [Pigmentiphaga humi]|uniref:ER-bound oxygenase mpaB/mpaB'/Rubber oxygenase catalytic domain-containing protein n=1 Tax=Pigmentiphaga humi TaxID=2478468 RepID=A0A3P4B0N5_9BURK|nr:oxygenase MpaB family protein [Pigmentiphaga humi]VCU69116.1 hypothetical protein PIGHUM_01176 [Pigmentiphaga humi]